MLRLRLATRRAVQRRQISYIPEAVIAVKNSAACQTDKFAAVKMC